MRRLRRALASAAAAIGGLLSAFRPAPGTTEGAVMLGLVLLSGGFLLADLAPLALIVPGVVILAIGTLPALRRP